jgi:putative ABC transport system substrate-binding protein
MNEETSLQLPNSCSDNLKSKIQNLKLVGIVALVVAFAACGAVALAQQPAGIPRIGFLFLSTTSVQAARVEIFRQRLRELGYVEGKNILIEYRFADGKLDRLPDLAAELVRLKVDVIVTTGLAVSAAKKASATIPIVFAAAGDPVGSGLVSSLARPGGNITGLSLMLPDLDGKRLELLKESFPKVARVARLWVSGTRGNLFFTEMEATAKALGLKLQSLEVRGLDDFDSAFARAKRDGAQALITNDHPLVNIRQRQVLDFAAKKRLPAIYPTSEFVEAGGLMSYAPNYTELYRRAADFVDKILKGTKPADIPVEQPTKFEFVINVKAAKQIGLTIPPKVLAQADKVIK